MRDASFREGNLSYPSKYGHVARVLVTKDQGSKGDTKGGYNGGYNSYQGESYGNGGTLGPCKNMVVKAEFYGKFQFQFWLGLQRCFFL